MRDVGDPVELATRYEHEGADEIVFLDISATAEERATLLDVARRTAERLFIPLTLGGGIRTADDVALALRAGADKVSINSAAVSQAGGARGVGVAIRLAVRGREHRCEARRGERGVCTRSGGRTRTELDAVEWARACVAHGAGEILLTSIDRDGTRAGLRSGAHARGRDGGRRPGRRVGRRGMRGATCARCSSRARADAALVAGMLHDESTTVRAIKQLLASSGIPVRAVA